MEEAREEALDGETAQGEGGVHLHIYIYIYTYLYFRYHFYLECWGMNFTATHVFGHAAINYRHRDMPLLSRKFTHVLYSLVLFSWFLLHSSLADSNILRTVGGRELRRLRARQRRRVV